MYINTRRNSEHMNINPDNALNLFTLQLSSKMVVLQMYKKFFFLKRQKDKKLPVWNKHLSTLHRRPVISLGHTLVSLSLRVVQFHIHLRHSCCLAESVFCSYKNKPHILRSAVMYLVHCNVLAQIIFEQSRDASLRLFLFHLKKSKAEEPDRTETDNNSLPNLKWVNLPVNRIKKNNEKWTLSSKTYI